MSHFRLHTEKKENLKYLFFGVFGLMVAGVLGYAVHSIGTARAWSRETILIYTEEEFVQYLLDKESEEYNLNGRYQLGEDLDLSGLEYSIGTNIEPFTGSLDGNGHAVTGLERPLFGVMKKARVENLFLGGANIQKPFTYSDGMHYVDGYSALSAYVVDSEIRNCGMNGEIHTASPSETEYHLAKASPFEAEEGPGVWGQGEQGAGKQDSEKQGTGIQNPKTDGPGIEGIEESSPALEGNETGKDNENAAGPGVGQEAGPGVQTSGEMDENSSFPSQIGTENTTEVGPGIEGTTKTETGEAEESSPQETGNTTIIPSDHTEEKNEGDKGEYGTQTEKETSVSSDGGHDETVTETTVLDMDMGTKPETGTGTKPETGTGTKPETGTGTKPETETGTKQETGNDGKLETEMEGVISSGTSRISGTAIEFKKEGVKTGGSAKTAEQAGPVDLTIAAEPVKSAGWTGYEVLKETVGFRSNEHWQLRMKIPEVAEINMEEVMTATPSDATPSDAEETLPETSPASEIQEDKIAAETKSEELVYIGNPEGDIYILVIADRITSGGLVAEIAGETLIADSFALVTIDSGVETTAVYSGGLIGIAGTTSRLENSYAAGLADAHGVTGGFAAFNEGTIQNCYSSMTIGKRGGARGAFTVMGNGVLSGCVYDRQLACVESNYEVSEEASLDYAVSATASQAEEMDFSLKGLNTSQMTGENAEIPGEWHLAEGAYPQLSYFALGEQEYAGASSKASAIALILPDGITLEDILEEEDIVLPNEVDGQQITWEADGNVQINDNNQVVLNPQAKVVNHDAPNVQSALETGPEEMTESEEMDSEELPQSETVSEGNASDREIGLIGSIGEAARPFVLSAVTPSVAAVTFANWYEVAKEVDAGTLTYYQPSKAGDYYQVETPEALAWISYAMNKGAIPKTSKIRLMKDIDLFGGDYNTKKYDSAKNNISDALRWIPIDQFEGTFDGGGHEVRNLLIVESDTEGVGFFRRTRGDNVLIQNFGIGSGSISNSKIRTGAIVGYLASDNYASPTPCKIINCWNRADVSGTSFVGGISGYLVAGDKEIAECYNTGTITATGSDTLIGHQGGAGGILGVSYEGRIIIRDCYNTGTIKVTGNNSAKSGTGGILGGSRLDTKGSAKVSNCYNVGNISGNRNVGSIVGGYHESSVAQNCYYLNTKVTDTYATPLTDTQLKSWGAAFALNNQSMKGPWEHQAREYPAFGTLTSPGAWSVIGQGALDGLVTAGKLTVGNGTAATPYKITTPEQLACFALKVNNTTQTGACGILEADIDLTGDNYYGTEIDALIWEPIGSIGPTMNYTGTFDGNGHVISVISLLGENYQGFFGVLGSGAEVKNTEVNNIQISSSYVSFIGGIAGYAAGTGVKITECGNTGTLRIVGDGVGGCLGGSSDASSVLVEGCYNTGLIKVNGNLAGGIVGSGLNGDMTIRNCYNRGEIICNIGDVGGIAGESAKTIYGCYNAGRITGEYVGGIVGANTAGNGSINNCITVAALADDPMAMAVSEVKLKTWGAAFYLNNEKLSQSTGLSWDYQAGKNGDYPYLTRETPRGAGDWSTVMEGTVNDFVTITKSSGSPYQISSADQLAWFAYEVNHGKPGQSAVLINDIDMAEGEKRYTASGHLNWTPAGRADSTKSVTFVGTFTSRNLSNLSDTNTIWKIKNLYCRSDGSAGLFGNFGGRVTGIGMVNADIAGTGGQQNYAGGIAGQLQGGTVRRCYNRKEGAGSSRVSVEGDGTRISYAGGIAGHAGNSSVLEDCYTLDVEITGVKTATLGGIVGNLTLDSSIRNSYSALEKNGKLEVSGTGKTGSITGSSAGIATGCWREKAYEADQAGISDFGAALGTNRQSQTNALNTLEGSGERKGENRSWYTSLLSEAPRGLPTLEPPVILNITLNPATTILGTTGNLSPTVPSAFYRGIREETPGDIPMLPLAAKTETSGGFYTMGTDNGNKKVTLATGEGIDLSTLSSKASLTEPTASVGAISSLTLYTGGAYIYSKDRLVLVDVAASGVRYEIRVKIPGVTSKPLSVSIPVKVGIEDLTPSGTKKMSYSADLSIKNNNNYPVKGKVLGLVPIKKTDYVELKPVARLDSYGSTKQLTDPAGGVKVGIADTRVAQGIIPSGGIYYTPPKGGTAEKWMEYQIKGARALSYRYFIEYEANPHYSDTNQYGYTVSYSFGISKEDMENSADGVVK